MADKVKIRDIFTRSLSIVGRRDKLPLYFDAAGATPLEKAMKATGVSVEYCLDVFNRLDPELRRILFCAMQLCGESENPGKIRFQDIATRSRCSEEEVKQELSTVNERMRSAFKGFWRDDEDYVLSEERSLDEYTVLDFEEDGVVIKDLLLAVVFFYKNRHKQDIFPSWLDYDS